MDNFSERSDISRQGQHSSSNLGITPLDIDDSPAALSLQTNRRTSLSTSERISNSTQGFDLHTSEENASLSSNSDDSQHSCTLGNTGTTPADSRLRSSPLSSPLSISSPNTNQIEEKKKRRNFCPYCKKLITNFSRHLVTQHKDEAEVKHYISLSDESPKKRKQKRAILTNKIRNIGNNMYNRKMIEDDRNDNYLPVKRSSHQKHKITNLTHVVCKHCLGFFKKESLHKHIPNCKQLSSDGCANKRETQETKKKVIMLTDHSVCMVKNNEGANELLKKDVFPKMQKDAETIIAQSDRTIAKYGSNIRFTHRTTKQISYCSSKMRDLSRLFLEMKKVLPEIKDFRDCIRPNHFNVLMDSVRLMSNFDNTTGTMKSAGVPSRLCSSLKRCANIIKSDSIKDETLTREQRMDIITSIDDFLFLMDKDWATEVGTNSEKSRKKFKVTKVDLLPDPEDIRTISQYISDRCPLLTDRLRQLPTIINYERLAKLIIVHIITLNRRRPNETVEITLEAYQTTLNKRLDYGQDLQSILSEEEINAGNELSIFYISANKNLKKVPTLLTKVFKQAVDALIEAREKIGITSKYLFGRLGSPELFNGSVVLREIVNKANLKSPLTFTANSLRHHAATSSQLHTRNDTFTKRLCQFMGHDLKTHENYYEMPLPLVQKYLVGPRLLQMTLPGPSSSKPETVTSNAPTKRDAAKKLQKYDRCETVTSNALANDISAGEEENVNKAQDSETSTFQAVSETNQQSISDANQQSISDANQQSTKLPIITKQTSKKSLSISNVNNNSDGSIQSTLTSGSGSENHFDNHQMQSQDQSRNDPDFVLDHRRDLRSSSSEEDCAITTDIKPKRKVFPKVRWTIVEKTAIYEHFGRHFVLKVNPTRQEIKQVWEKEETLQKRTLQQVVTYVNNIANDKHSISTPLKQKMKNMVANGREKFSP